MLSCNPKIRLQGVTKFLILTLLSLCTLASVRVARGGGEEATIMAQSG